MQTNIKINTNGNFVVTGELNFTTAPKLFKLGCKLIESNQHSLVFDLQPVTFSDNTGCALIVAWTRCAKKINKEIKFINLPKQLYDIIAVTNLNNFIPIN